MKMSKRIKLFVFGAILGSIIMYFFVLKDRNIYLGPEEVIITKIQTGKPQISPLVKCKMDCLGITSNDIKTLLETADVDFGASDVHGKPCKTYIINNDNKDAVLMQVSFQFCDTNIVFSNFISTSNLKCDCK